MTSETLDEKSDAQLVREFQSGSEKAFSQIMTRYKVRAVQLALMSVGNMEDAKDVAQEAFVKCHKGLMKFEMKSEFSTWFYRILMNQVKDFLRSQKWKRFMSFKKNEEMDSFFESVSDSGHSPSHQTLDQELYRKMTEAIKKLPFQQNWIFSLRYLKGFSIQQIAEVTELSEGTVKATLHFAAQKFKKEIYPYLEGEKDS